MDGPHLVLHESNIGGGRSPATARTVRSYNLFGEAADLPDVVHCETIAARSVLHEWEFAPHRHARLHQILLIERGGGEAILDERTVRLRPMQAINVPVGEIHGFRFVPGTQGWVVTLAAEMLDQVLEPSQGLRRVLAQARVMTGTAPMRAAMRQIFAEFDGRAFARAHILRGLCAVLLGLVARERAEGGETQDTRADSRLFHRFEALLERHFLQHWTVADYAARLAITPTHLSRVTRAASGQAASAVIAERIVREARRNLVYTNLPVSTIAYALGFEDPAYFSRLFTKATGASPRAFRDRVQQTA